VGTVSAAIGELGAGVTDVDGLVERVMRRRLLLVLDSCEHLRQECANLAARLVAQGSEALTVVATTRQVLGVAGERVLRLEPLAVPAPEETSPTVIVACDAVRLFLERWSLGSDRSELTDDEVVLIGRICRATDGLPRQLEGAAAACRQMDLASLAGALDAGGDAPPVTQEHLGPDRNDQRGGSGLAVAHGRLGGADAPPVGVRRRVVTRCRRPRLQR